MKKLLSLLVLFLSLSDFASAQVKNVITPMGADGNEQCITLTTSKEVGSRIQLTIEAEGAFTIEGVEEAPKSGFSGYTLTDSNLKITGNVTTFGSTYCNITRVDVTKMPSLKVLDLFGNPIEVLDLSNNAAIENLTLGGTQLFSLDISKCPMIQFMNISSCPIETLTMDNNNALLTILAKSTKIKDFNFAAVPNLEILDCSYCGIDKLDLSSLKALTQLSCAGNNLTELDITNNKFIVLNCNVNKLKSIDLSGQDKLQEFACMQNELTSIDASDCKDIFAMMICSNKIGYKNMTEFSNSLPAATDLTGYMTIVDLKNAEEGNECGVSNVNTISAKNWEVYDYNGGDSFEGYGIPFAGTDDEQLAIDNVEENDFTVYYSESARMIYVSGFENGAEIKLFDIQGRTIASQKAYGEVATFELSNLNNGMYVVSVGKQCEKVLVK